MQYHTTFCVNDNLKISLKRYQNYIEIYLAGHKMNVYNLHAKFWPSFFLFGSRKLAVSNNDHAHVHNQYLAIRGRSFPYCFWPSLSSCLEFLSALSWQPCNLSGSACLHTCCRLSQENQSGHALPIRQKLSSPCQSTNIMKTKHYFQTFGSIPMISVFLLQDIESKWFLITDRMIDKVKSKELIKVSGDL